MVLVKFTPSTLHCENKLLILEKSSTANTYALRAVDKNVLGQVQKFAVTKINEIAKVLQTASIDSDQANIESVAARINTAKEKHNKSLLLRLFKSILPNFIFDRLPFLCLKEYRGVALEQLISNKECLEEMNAKIEKVLTYLAKEQSLKGTLHEIDESCKRAYLFSPLDYAMEHQKKSEEELQKEFKFRINLAKAIQELFEPNHIQESLEKTVDHLCEKYHITETDAVKEARLLGVDQMMAKMKMVKRLTVYLKAGLNPKTHSPSMARRQEATGFEISILKGIEKIFKKYVQEGKGVVIRELKDTKFTIIISQNDVLIEEKLAGTGTSKAVKFASDYFKMKTADERVEYVTVKLKSYNPKKSADMQTKAASSPSTKGRAVIASALQEESVQKVAEQFDRAIDSLVSAEGAPSGSVVIKEPPKKGPIPTFEATDEKMVGLSESQKRDSVELREATFKTVMRTLKKIEQDDVKNKNLHGLKSLLKNGVKKIQTLFKKKETPVQHTFSAFIPYDYDDPTHFQGLPYEKWRTGALNLELDYVKKGIKAVGKHTKEAIQLKRKEALLVQLIEERKLALAEMIKYETPEELEEFRSEIEMTKLFQGPGVVEVHKVIDVDSDNKILVLKAAGFAFEVAGEQGVSTSETVVELNDLAKLHRKGKLNETQKQQLMTILDDAFEGIERMHALGYIHRDLKPQNILVTKRGRGVVADFGTACKKEDDPAKSCYYGSPLFSAPELCACSDSDRWKTIDDKSDVWSAGMILMHCCFEGKSSKNHPLLKGHSVPETIKEIFEEIVNKPKNKAIYETNFPEPEDKNSLQHLIWWATRIDPEERPTMAEFRKEFNEIRHATASTLTSK